MATSSQRRIPADCGQDRPPPPGSNRDPVRKRKLRSPKCALSLFHLGPKGDWKGFYAASRSQNVIQITLECSNKGHLPLTGARSCLASSTQPLRPALMPAKHPRCTRISSPGSRSFRQLQVRSRTRLVRPVQTSAALHIKPAPMALPRNHLAGAGRVNSSADECRTRIGFSASVLTMDISAAIANTKVPLLARCRLWHARHQACTGCCTFLAHSGVALAPLGELSLQIALSLRLSRVNARFR